MKRSGIGLSNAYIRAVLAPFPATHLVHTFIGLLIRRVFWFSGIRFESVRGAISRSLPVPADTC